MKNAQILLKRMTKNQPSIEETQVLRENNEEAVDLNIQLERY